MHFGTLILATILPLLVLIAIYALDFYQMGEFRFVIFCLVWGGIAFALARFINRGVYFAHLVSYPDFPRYFAPLVEEILKAIILVYFVHQLGFTYFVDVAIFCSEHRFRHLRELRAHFRRTVGSYAMLYVRNIFPQETGPLWSLLVCRIQECAHAQSTTTGGNLFTILDQRLTKRSAEQNDA
jgi:hypothetical protein